MHYIIDGYNLLFRTTRARESEDLKAERQQIIQELSNKLKIARLDASLIFDAHLKEGLGQQFFVKDLSVYFTDKGETADDYILEVVRQSPNPAIQTVVTSDTHLAWRVRRRGAHSLPVEEFRKTLERIYRKKLSPSPSAVLLKPLSKKITLEERYEKIFAESAQEEVLPKRKKSTHLPKETEILSDYERWLKAFEKDSGT